MSGRECGLTWQKWTARKAYYLNEYLRTGEEATLKQVFRSWERETAQWANKDFFSKLQKLQQWNSNAAEKPADAVFGTG